MRSRFITLCLCLLLGQSVVAHEVVLEDQQGAPLVKIKFRPEWTSLASSDGLELTSPDGRNRIHCMEFRSYVEVEEGVVFLQTLRDTLFQSYETVSEETIDFQGKPARLVQGKGVSRGFETKLQALIFRSSGGNICLVMLQQDVGYESSLPPLRELVTLP